MVSPARTRLSSHGLMIVWGLFVGSGFLLLQMHGAHPGAASSPPTLWPEASPVEPGVGRSTLLIFLHPGCPCSGASVEELACILGETADRVTTYALLLSPAHSSEGWGRSSIATAVAALPDVHVVPDRGGTLARRFGVETSGHVVVYDALGHLAFSGGITAARGHRGNNEGHAAVIDVILGKRQSASWFPVFGCPLRAIGAI